MELNQIICSFEEAVKELALSKEDLEGEINKNTILKIIKKSLKKSLMISKSFGNPNVFKITTPLDYKGLKLVPGKTYVIKFFPIITWRVHSKICVKFISNQPNVLFIGNEIITLMETLDKKEFPKKKYIVSFAEGKDVDNEILYIYISPDSSLRYYSTLLNCFWDKDTLVVCLFDE